MSKNTSELWSVVPGFYPGFVEIFGASFKISVVTHAADISLVESMNRIEDARRIVACVNACAGLPTEKLESSPLGGVLNGVAGLIAQRDELLAALEAFTSAQDAKRSASGNGAGPIAAAIGDLVIAEERARAAIAKAKGV